ncbi:hypothetical protein ACFWSF_26520 [Streptomyces sp. NPDC058611]|uniref:hypothetical protein n=1 Tax=unclassified Streptomyces TaxID=2593676 RepID=UPI00364EF996
MRNSAKLLLRALIFSGAVVATMSSTVAYADAQGDGGGYTNISNINNNNTYVYQGLGAISLGDLLGTGTGSSLLAQVGSLTGRPTL